MHNSNLFLHLEGPAPSNPTPNNGDITREIIEKGNDVKREFFQAAESGQPSPTPPPSSPPPQLPDTAQPDAPASPSESASPSPDTGQ